MPTRRSVLALVLGSALAVAAAVAPPARAVQSDATAFISDLGTKALGSLVDKSLSDEERAKRFRELFVGNFDVPSIGRTVLGRYWKSATPEQQQAYLKTFEDYIVYIYSVRFKRYSGETLAVSGAKDLDNGYVRVQSTVKSPDGEDVPLVWDVRRKDADMKIVDVSIAGVSMVQTQQREFASVVQQNGGSVDALIEQMQKKIGK
jgi:phospholipid transport system substrate-binding protein